MKVSIVIPMYGRWDLVQARIIELATHILRRKEIEIIIVDDASGEQNLETNVNFWMGKNLFGKLTFYQASENKGFARNCNRGIEMATGDVVVIHTTDVAIHGDYVSRFLERCSKDANSLFGPRLIEFDTGWNTFGGKTFPYLEGWMLGANKEVWNQLRFDEEYERFDYEDMDLSQRAVKLGFGVKEILLPVAHLGEKTIRHYFSEAERLNQTHKNREVFKSKWVI